MGGEIGEDLPGTGRGTPVQDEQVAPVQPADAPAGVAPGHPGTEGQFGTAVHIRPGGRDLRAYLAEAPLDRTGVRVLAVVHAQELLGLAGVHGILRVPGPDRGVAITGYAAHVSTSPRSG